MSKRFGHIQQRGERTYRLFYEALRAPGSPQRAQRTETVHGTRRQAEARLRQIGDEVRAGVESHPPPDVTVRAVLERWLADMRPSLAPRGFERYESHVRHRLIPAFGQRLLADLGDEEIRAARDTWLQRLAPATVTQALRVLCAALDDAVRRGELSGNPARLVRCPRVLPPAVAVYSAEEVERLLASCPGHALGSLTAIALLTGLRLGELLGLRWQDVDLERAELQVCRSAQRVRPGRITFKEPKSRSGRRLVSLTPEAVKTLQEQRRWQVQQRLKMKRQWEEHDLVFSSKWGTPLDHSYVTVKFRELLHIAGLPRLKFHALRHTFATLLLKESVPVKVVSELLGHGSARTTLDIYGHVVPGMRQDAARALASLLARTRAVAGRKQADPSR